MASIRSEPRAEADLADLAARSAARNPPASARLGASVATALARLARLPELYAVVNGPHRLCPIDTCRTCWRTATTPLRTRWSSWPWSTPARTNRRGGFESRSAPVFDPTPERFKPILDADGVRVMRDVPRPTGC